MNHGISSALNADIFKFRLLAVHGKIIVIEIQSATARITVVFLAVYRGDGNFIRQKYQISGIFRKNGFGFERETVIQNGIRVCVFGRVEFRRERFHFPFETIKRRREIAVSHLFERSVPILVNLISEMGIIFLPQIGHVDIIARADGKIGFRNFGRNDEFALGERISVKLVVHRSRARFIHIHERAVFNGKVSARGIVVFHI